MGPGGMGHRLPPGMSPEIPYESRYFSVTLDSKTGSVIQAETSRIVSVDTAQAVEYAKRVLSGRNPSGFTDRFRYMVRSENKISP